MVTQKTLVVFNNTYGICVALVYNDYRRRSEDKIAEVPAGCLSNEIELTPSASEPFYFAYLLNLNGINDFSIHFQAEELSRRTDNGQQLNNNGILHSAS